MTREEFINWFEERFVLTKNDIYEFGQLYDEVTKPHWISVEDELPPWNVFVLTCDRQENTNLLMLAGDGRWYDKAVGLQRNITHWMPMPAPPHHIIDANKKVDRVVGTADHIKTALDVLNKKGGENENP